MPQFWPPPDGSLALKILDVGKGVASVLLWGTTNGESYTLLSAEALTTNQTWMVEQDVTGAAGTNATLIQVPTFGRRNLFLWAHSGLDSGPRVLFAQILGIAGGVVNLGIYSTSAGQTYEVMSQQTLSNAEWVSEGTVLGLTNWTAAAVPIGVRTNSLYLQVRSWISSEGSGLPDWWQLKYFGHLGVDPYADPDGDGVLNIDEFRNGTNPNQFDTPPAPTGFVALLDPSGTSVTLAWNPSPGPVASYTIQRAAYVVNQNTGLYEIGTFQPIAQVSGNTTTFQDTGSFSVGDPDPDSTDWQWNLPDFQLYDNSVYRIWAVYTRGASPPADTVLNGGSPAFAVDARLIRGATGRWELVCPAVPARISALRLDRFDWDYYHDTGTFLNSEDVPAASLTAGAYVIPDGEIVNHLGHVLWVAGLGPSGQPGTAVKAGTVSLDAPYFVDGRQHAKENLIFFLRAAGLWQPYWAGDYRDCMSAGCRFDSGTNCVVSGFIERAIEGKWYSDPQSFVALQNLWPFVVNYHLRNAVYDPTVAPPGPWGWMFQWYTNFTTIPAPAVLSHSEPYWIEWVGEPEIEYVLGVENLPNVGATLSADGETVSLASSFNNMFGLAGGSAICENSWLWGSFSLQRFMSWHLAELLPSPTVRPCRLTGASFKRPSSARWTTISLRSSAQAAISSTMGAPHRKRSRIRCRSTMISQ